MEVNEMFSKIDELECLDNYEFISINLAVGRVLAEDIIATKPLPFADNSALDGYAFNYNDINSPLKILGTIFAGDKKEYSIGKNECYKIMTGAIFPTGSDTVVMLEDEAFDENGNLIVPKHIKKDNARKLKGEELGIGELLLSKSTLLNAAKIMLLASQGISFVKVFAKPKIAVFSTGNEINEPWQTCDDRSIYNANALGISSLLLNNGFESEYKGILKDEKQSLKQEIIKASNYDVIITSGGASKGEADFMKSCLQELGYECIVGSIDIRPAGPTKIFKKGKQLVFILPGNPMSCYIGCFLSVIPAIKKISRSKEYLHETCEATFNGDMIQKGSRANIVLGNYMDGKFTPLNKNNKFSPAMIKPLANANALYLSKIGENEISDKTLIKIIKLS
ncbi:molybdopterin molybdenumtransferase [Campylobacter iguaniorum]|uniref:molybdopterin molybdotransferase MoeA n=1 Tax=Campylobacter iguaniorum TaxID=1244531 RepID=UPI0007C9573A|nr:molybdopterin molybdotransferase MoeA [Campylobacter iguaniorum]ANE35863.1 molybdopterin molybdenumtransferase [Campylobacter iguaniorum]